MQLLAGHPADLLRAEGGALFGQSVLSPEIPSRCDGRPYHLNRHECSVENTVSTVSTVLDPGGPSQLGRPLMLTRCPSQEVARRAFQPSE